jgi:hypothetical protein
MSWNGTPTSVAMPGTHMYQRGSPLRRLSRSATRPPSRPSWLSLAWNSCRIGSSSMLSTERSMTLAT